MANKKAYLLGTFLSLGIFLFAIRVLAIPAPIAPTPNSTTVNNGVLIVDPNSQVKFKPNITIPNSDFKAGVNSSLNTTDLMSNYIVSLYRYGAIFATIVAMFMLVLAGWKWLMAAGNSERINSAKDTINGALVGLALLFGGYLLMSQISTKLVEFGTLIIAPPKFSQAICETYLNQKDCEEDKLCRWDPTAENNIEGTMGLCTIYNAQICSADSQVVPIITASNLTVTASEPKLMPEANEALQDAVDSLEPGEALTVTSAYRSWALQQSLYECYINKVGNICPNGCRSCNEAAKPDCDAPHQTGLAVDICYRGANINTCTNEIMTSTYNCIGSTVAPCTAAISQAETRLRDIMVAAGFTPYAGEWWHLRNS